MKYAHRHNPLFVAITIATLPALSAFSPPTLAQSGAEAIEEVVVTARRREENLQDVPIAVTAFSAEALEMRGAADISEIAQIAPSVTLEPSRATNSTLTAFIRGVGQQDPLAGFEQGVALYVDDVYLARPMGSLLDIYDVERVEVLRGPQGTLYGRNAVGGAIKYVTRRLEDDPALRLKGSLGKYGQREMVATASTPITDGFKVGATVANLERDGYGDNLATGKENYNKDVFAYRLSAELTPSDDWLIRLAYDHTDDDSDPVAGYRPAPGAFSGYPVLDRVWDTAGGVANAASSAGINGNNEVEVEGASLSVDWNVTEAWTARSITAWREDRTESVIDFDALPVIDLDAPVIYENDQFSQEFQLLYNSDRLHAVTGLYYLDAYAANDFDVVIGQTGILVYGFPLTALTSGEVETEAWSVFADVTYDLTAQWSLSVGGRYTEDERIADVFRANYFGMGSPAFGNTSAVFLAATSDYEADRTFTDFAPRVNLSYQMNEDVNLYLGYSKGWKAGSFDARGANFSSPEVVDGFEPEELHSYEAGLKATWLEGRARTNIAIFHSDYEDMQIPGSIAVDSDGDGINDGFVGAVTNAAESEIRGLEFEGLFLLTDALSAQMALSLLDAEMKKWLVNGVDVSGNRAIQNTPETMAYLGLTYSVPVAGGDLNLNVNWSYKDEIVQFEVPVESLDQGSYSLYNASIVWLSGDEHWTVGLHGKNLGEEEVKTSGYCFGVNGCGVPLGLENNNTVFYAPPRTFTTTVEYRF